MKDAELFTPPEPAQMFSIAAIAVCMARDQGKLRESRKVDNARLFLPKYIDKIDITADDYKTTTQSFIGRVARHGAGKNRSWTMQIVEKLWISEEEGADDTLRITHAFGWNADAVTLSKRTLQAKENTEDIYDVDYFPDDDPIFYPDLLHGIGQMEVVTQADCVDLTQSLRAFSQESKDILQYNR